MFKYLRECNVNIESFDDAIQILENYEKLLGLKSSHALISYFKKFKDEQNLELKREIQKSLEALQIKNKEYENKIKENNEEILLLNNQNNQYKDEITRITNINDQFTQSMNNFEKIYELNKTGEYDTIYTFLKKLSSKNGQLKMSVSCAIGLSERSRNNNYPLIQACIRGDLQLVKSLIEGGCKKEVTNKYGNNCLIEASYKGQLEIIKYLIGTGFNKDWQNQISGVNAILASSKHGHIESFKYLQDIGCDVNSKNKNNINCIYNASSEGHLEFVKYLFSCRVNPNEKDKDGFSSLIIASKNGHLDVVKYLIDCGCDKNAKTYNNDSSLHCAAKEGHFEVVQYLVTIGVNLNDRNNYGKTPFDFANEKQNQNNNYKRIADLLLHAKQKYDVLTYL
ncbi:hypothetical protein TVAG_361100 [Trichomonas vaginalis G3]|uniref:Uncharacterized protein n=1 Tax=Trichomonas vaginalis (strain ATCC PRA-98 / G3) TaxID=412133 RepID=A2FNE7_TRIV3|nr:protein ubiquitination [Trichomonas vaginalis G3]EAX93555.1 hypothetical protein TVAG_361100 [Trichomonas vaginalis G3]KAI5501472.1 protein ubiquitination [Trichomonas vaginalis G3]|eukprot:XP_001306485.1 hypothetical protein [Trichomonas vaginalis G3]